MKRGIPVMGIVFLIIGLLIANSSYKSITKDSPLEKETVENAFYAGASGPSSQNDGQVVIVSGLVEQVNPAYDREFRLTLPSPRASRTTYVYAPNKDEDNDWEYDESEEILGQVMVGGYHISPQLLEDFRTRTTLKSFDADELEAAGLSLIEDSTTDERFFLKTSGDQVRYHYEIFDLDRHDKVTLTGRQNGDSLEKVSEMKKFSVVEEELDKEELLKYMSDSRLTGKVLGISAAILFIGLGFSRIRLWFLLQDQ